MVEVDPTVWLEGLDPPYGHQHNGASLESLSFILWKKEEVSILG